MIIELHILQNFAPSNLNRDDTNSPKECEFGGYRRARISSQCIKRSIRYAGKDPKDETAQSVFERNTLVPLGKRTHLIVSPLCKRMKAAGKTEDDAIKVATEFTRLYSSKKGKMNTKNPDQTAVLLYMSEQELDEIAKQLLAFDWGQLLPTINIAKPKNKKDDEDKEENDEKTTAKSPLKKMVDEWVKQTEKRPSAPDIALFGRMLADRPETNIDAACQVAHAISTHKVGVEFDFYTAVDDLQPNGETGASMMGTVEFNSACFYRYANVNFKQLKKNLGGDAELAKKTVEAFIRASVNAIPTGKQNSFAAQNPPSFVFAVARKSGAWSLANAFVEPVWVGENGDLIEESTVRLVDYWGKLAKAYGDKDIQAKPAYTLDTADLKGLDTVDSLEHLIAKVNQAVAAEC
jgi:CRISPR system Cascade subunit CasC